MLVILGRTPVARWRTVHSILAICTFKVPPSPPRSEKPRYLPLASYIIYLMNTETLKQRLLAKEQELIADISRFESEARDSRSAEVEDPIDIVISSENKAAGFQESTLAAQTLKQVRQALQRIEDGTYGNCVDCGRPIEPARLEAVPWASYCRADQEKHEKAGSIDPSLAI